MSRISTVKKAAIRAARAKYKTEQEYQKACFIVDSQLINPDEKTWNPWNKPNSNGIWDGKFKNEFGDYDITLRSHLK